MSLTTPTRLGRINTKFEAVRKSALAAAAKILWVPYMIWELTESNFPTFVIPNTSFGILGSLAGQQLADGDIPSVRFILERLPLVVAFNWYSVLIFDLANQRLPESVKEDILNKPWRPVPSNKITSEQLRRGMLLGIPIVIGFNFYLGVWREGAFILILTWMYNDLKGCDELVRDAIIGVAYSFFNHASLQLALGPGAVVNDNGRVWIGIISAVIFTTMQVQDLKDQEGDRSRGRRTVALYFGDKVSRWSIAFFVLLWPWVCGYFWSASAWIYAVPFITGAMVAWHVLARRTPLADALSWKLWCLWTMTLYSIPLLLKVASFATLTS